MKQGNLRKQMSGFLMWGLLFGCAPVLQASAVDSDSANEGAAINIYYTRQGITVSGKIVWNDQDDQARLRPNEVSVSLLVNGNVAKSSIVTSEEENFCFTNLSPTDNLDSAVKYTVTSEPVTGYTTKVTGSVEDGFTITYSHLPIDEETASDGSMTLTDTDKSGDIPVYGRYTIYQTSTKVISVDVEWDSMDFIYTVTQNAVWNPETHKYDHGDPVAAWNKDASVITVTNHSNVGVTASFRFDQESSVSGIFKDDNGEVTVADLKAGVWDKYDDADKKTVQFVIDGKLDAETSNDLGNITVSVEENR